jgi:bifunctional non-homologous end joining protein LigD
LRAAERPPYDTSMLWRTPPRSRRRPPADFILPAQPTLVAKPPSGPEWTHEIKHDGYRLLARKAADRVVLWTRHGTDFTARLPSIAEAVRSLPVDNFLIDGEAVALRPDGHGDFAALRTKRGSERARFVAFDLLQIEGEDQRKLALEVRRAELEALLAGQDAIMFSVAIEAAGELVFAKACEMGLEGIVSKRLGAPYYSGRVRNWLKVKNPAFVRE